MMRMRRAWSAKEDGQLRDLVQREMDNDRPILWRELAQHIPGRSNKDCRKRWWNSLAGGTVKGAWSPEEDKRLMDAVEKYGANWPQVAAAVGSRYADQCSSHWRQVLNPNINYCDWTTEEDQQLLHAVAIHRTNWSTIASFHSPERTTLALKNRYWKLRLQSQKEHEPTAGRCCSSTRAARDMRPTTYTTPPNADDADHDDDGSNEDEVEENTTAGERDACNDEEGEVGEYGGHVADFQGHDHWTDWSELFCDWASNSDQLGQPGSPAKASAWAGRHARTSGLTGSLTDSNTTAAENISNTLQHGNGFLGTAEHQDGKQAGMPFAVQGTGSVFTEGPISLDAEFPFEAHPADAMSDNLGSSVTTFPTIGAINPDLGSQCIDPALWAPDQWDNADETVSHQVSIHLSCTSGQLSKVVPLLANTGLVVNIKIDRQ